MRYVSASFLYAMRQLFRYRAKLFFSWLGHLLFPLWLSTVFVRGLLADDPSLDHGHYMSYVLLANAMGSISLSDVEVELAAMIRSGSLAYLLVLPRSIAWHLFIQGMMKKVALLLCMYFPLGCFFIRYLTIDVAVLWTLIYVLFSIVIGYFLSLIIGFMAFRMSEIWGVTAIKSLGLGLFAGTVVPLEFLPDGLYRVLRWTPFPFIAYYPGATLMGWQGHHSVETLFQGLLWIIILLALAYGLWKHGMKRFEAYQT